MSENQFLTVAEVAKLYNKSLQTLYRHIKVGKITRGHDGLIALSECLRAYGAIPNHKNVPVNPFVNPDVKTSDNMIIDMLKQQIDMLKHDLTLSLEREKQGIEREKQAHEREQRLMALLEYRTGERSQTASEHQKESTFDKVLNLFKKG